MSKKLYKYIGPDFLEKVFDDNYCIFKCSYPKDFNDPYELFLTIDFNQEPELLAYYQEVIGELPQKPTTCFSQSPCIIPMWAHYAHNHRGIAVEIDEKKIKNHLPDVRFGDVDYLDEPSNSLLDLLHRAYAIGKPRYHFMLQQRVFSAAYYTKQSFWKYELERRIVASEDSILKRDDLLLLRIPNDCVTSIIVGQLATKTTLKAVSYITDKIGIKFYKLKIGKLTPEPFFVDTDQNTYMFDGNKIVRSQYYCELCGEPTKENNICGWCAIQDHHRRIAASNNPFRALAHAGLLDDYYKEMSNTGK